MKLFSFVLVLIFTSIALCAVTFTDIDAGLTGLYISTTAWGDYDNDGDLDALIAGNTGSQYVTKLYRNDSGTFTDIAAGLTGAGMSSADWGDYDNDGDQDILIAGYTGSQFLSKIYRNDAGVFTDIYAPLTGVYYCSAKWGDYDNDNDLDVLLTGNSGSMFVTNIYQNNSGVFTDIIAGLPGVAYSYGVWGDYDNDSDLDILLTGDTGSQLISKIYKNNAGAFTDIGAGLTGVSYSSAAWGDYDNDGDPDILLAGYTGVEPYYVSQIYQNNSGSFTNISAGLTSIYSGSVSWGDYDNDGDLDIILTGDAGTEKVSKIYNNVSGVFTDISAGLTAVLSSSASWGDYDNDNDLDLLLSGDIGSASGITKIYRNDMDFNEADTGIPGLRRSSVAWGDYDDDGDLDAVLSGETAPLVYFSEIYRNDSGVFSDINAGLTALTCGTTSFGDYDNDGDLDILQNGFSDVWPYYYTNIYRNDSGEFSKISADLIGTMYGSADWGDYDNDGDLDIALTGYNFDTPGTNISLIYRNDSGIFTDIGADLPGVIYGSASWGDFDIDGDLDLVLTGFKNGVPYYIASVFRNDSGVFNDAGAGLNGVYSSSVDWGDYDNDGDPDLVVNGIGSSETPITKIYRNDAGIFNDIIAGFPGTAYGTVNWGDYDNDGDLDLLITGNTGTAKSSKIYRNDAGIFSDAGIFMHGVDNSAASWVDYDNDNDLDIFMTGGSAAGYVSAIYRNNIVTPNTVPITPANLSASASGHDVVLSWDKATDTETLQNGLSYNLYIGTSDQTGDVKSPMSSIANGYRKIVASGNSGQRNSWSAKDLSAGTYYWSVQAVDNAFAGSAFTALSSSFTVMDAPVATDASSITLTKFTANWGSVSGASGYMIDVDDDIDFSSPLPGYDELNTGNVLSYRITGLTSEATYFYRIKAVNSYGSSLYSNIITVVTPSDFTDIDSGLPGISIGSIAWGDYDSDGDLDILMSGNNGATGITKIHRNDGGVFTDINADIMGLFYGSVSWGDYDNDGDLDILLTGYIGIAPYYISKIYRNDAGIFSDINAGLYGVMYSSTAWGDYDSDGDLDIVLAGFSDLGNVSKIYRNDSGIFSDINAHLTGVYYCSVAWADYDKDGDLDLLLTGNNGTQRVSVIYNNNYGMFSETAAGLLEVECSSVAWNDYDSDGDPDILLTGSSISGNVSKIYRNDEGIFTDISATITGISSGSTSWGDYDNDGDADILLAGCCSALPFRLSKIYNNDAGVFTEFDAGITAVENSSAAWGDYDNDNDLDILLSGNNGAGNLTEIYSNNSEIFNTAPGKPSKLVTLVENDSLKLSFNPASDGQTPQSGLTYNINLLLNGLTVKSAMSNLSNGFRKIVSSGNISQNKFFYMNDFVAGLPQSEKRVAWKVQSVDNNFKGSEFATSLEFDFSGRDLEVISKPEMLGTDFLKWEYSSGEYLDHYILQLDDDNKFGSPIQESISFDKSMLNNPAGGSKTIYVTKTLNTLSDYDSLRNNITYYWRVKPVYSGENNASMFNSYPLSFVFNPGNIPPYPPVSGFNPANDDIESSLPKLSWNNALDPDGHAEDLYYIFQLDTTSAFGTIQYADTTAAGITSLQVTSALPAGYRYYYRVKSIDADALQSAWSATQNFLIVMPPQNLKITKSGGNIDLTWDSVPINSKGIVYTVYSSTNPYAAFPSGWTVSAAQLTSNSWSEPHSATKKFYKITVGSSSK